MLSPTHSPPISICTCIHKSYVYILRTFIVSYTFLLCLLCVLYYENPRISGNINGNILNIICFLFIYPHIDTLIPTLSPEKHVQKFFASSHLSTWIYQHSANIYEINRFSNYLKKTGSITAIMKYRKVLCCIQYVYIYSQCGGVEMNARFLNKEWIKFMLCCYNISWLFVEVLFFLLFCSSFAYTHIMYVSTLFSFHDVTILHEDGFGDWDQWVWILMRWGVGFEWGIFCCKVGYCGAYLQAGR